ncbi:endolytic transglycosylase MltG [Streptosporangium sp. NPDC048865]|uniref:endolytic transglycosylase MltG n=1 Tax=Streptosporangium sp. NPDC048865 TaxID=3155766 RepID=UPI003413F2D6
MERDNRMTVRPNLGERAVKRGPSSREAVTAASAVRAGVGRDRDHAEIARVIGDRIGARTPLRQDATAPYARGHAALGARGAWAVSGRGAEVRPPYGARPRPGPPSGAAVNLREKALIAILQPDQGDWFWFVTINPEHRITKFTDKESEFVRNREELNRYLGKR